MLTVHFVDRDDAKQLEKDGLVERVVSIDEELLTHLRNEDIYQEGQGMEAEREREPGPEYTLEIQNILVMVDQVATRIGNVLTDLKTIRGMLTAIGGAIHETGKCEP